jgi:lysophosphatidylcholine acyltransferase/lyso-PAF acetyltransferase
MWRSGASVVSVGSGFHGALASAWWSPFAAPGSGHDSDADLKRLNPFQTSTGMNLREWVKVVLGVCLVVPVRLALVVSVVLVGTLLMSLTLVGCDVSRPLSARRQYAQSLVCRATAALLCLSFGIYRVRTVGRRCEVGEAKLQVIAPHSTVMDPVVMSLVLQAPSSVGKAEARRSLVGPFIAATQSIFVDRGDKGSRARVQREINERARLDSPWQRPLALFPEGTCTNRSALIQFKKGAFEAGAPVQPVLMHWHWHNFDPAWTNGAPSRSFVLLRTLAQLFHSVTVEFLPVYVPSAQERADPLLFASNVRALMADRLGLPTSEHSYEDSFLAAVAAKHGLMPAKALPFSFAQLALLKPASMTSAALYDRAKALLLLFAKAPGMTPDAALSREQFSAIAQLAADGAKPLDWEQLAGPDAASVSFYQLLTVHLRRVQQ